MYMYMYMYAAMLSKLSPHYILLYNYQLATCKVIHLAWIGCFLCFFFEELGAFFLEGGFSRKVH